VTSYIYSTIDFNGGFLYITGGYPLFFSIMAGTHPQNRKFPKQPLSGHMTGLALTSPPWRQNQDPLFSEKGAAYNVA